MIEPTVLAYAAGMIDGDGCVQVNKKKRKDLSNIYYSITASVSQVNEDVPNWLMRNFGGTIFKYTLNKEKRQPLYRWSIHCKQASNFLQLILPYLVQKSERSKLAIHLQELMVPKYEFNGKNPVRMKPSYEEQTYRESIFKRMKELNKSTGRNHFKNIGVN